MDRFSTPRAAKEYLVSRILAQAQQDGVALSDPERKMLYFSESGWTLPDMTKVNAEFEQEHNDAEYEEKIETVIRRIRETQDEPSERDWNAAVDRLRTEDHYLLVMIDAAQGHAPSARPPGDLRRLIFTASVVVALLTGFGFFLNAATVDESLTRYLFAGFFLAVLGTLVYFKVVRWR